MMPDTASLWSAARRFEGVLRMDEAAYSFAPLSDIYRQLGLLEDALETARRGCRIHPDFAAGQMALARAALECANRDEALKALEAVVRITPENLEAQRLLADFYTADGNEGAALRCLSIVGSLDLDFAAPVAPPSAESIEEELLDADILELSDELIEEEVPEAASPFAALPERPSLGEDFNRAEPFLMESPPPLYKVEPTAEEPSTVMASATIAELYVSQGFPERGADVYRELIAADPQNKVYEKRLMELTHPPAPFSAEAQISQPEGLLEKLQEWLGNIGRVREWRTRNL